MQHTLYNNYVNYIIIMSSHTTLSIDKKIYNRAAKQAKKQHISVSAVARMLLDAYAAGHIHIGASPTIEFGRLSNDEITPEIKKSIRDAKKLPRSAFTNAT